MWGYDNESDETENEYGDTNRTRWVVSANWTDEKGHTELVSTNVRAPNQTTARVRGMVELRSRYHNGSLHYVSVRRESDL